MNNLDFDIIMQDSVSSIAIIALGVIFGIAVGVLYHKIFIVFYTDLGRQLLTEIFISLFVGVCIAALTLVFWWITAIIIAIIGLILILKAQSKTGRIAVLILFIIFEVALIIVGVRINSFKKDDQKSNTSTNTYSYQVPNPTAPAVSQSSPVVSSAPVSNPSPEPVPSTTSVAQTNSVVGTWKVARIMDAYGSYTLAEWAMASIEAEFGNDIDRNSEDYQMALELIEKAVNSLAYEFKENGTIVVSASVDGQTSSQTGTYQLQRNQVTIVMDGQTSVMEFDSVSNTLSQSQDGTTLIMTKQ